MFSAAGMICSFCSIEVVVRHRNPGTVVAALFLTLLCSQRLHSQTREPAGSVEDSMFVSLVKPDEPGLAVLVRKNGRAVLEGENRRAYEFPACFLHQAIHRHGYHSARTRRQIALRRNTHGNLSRLPRLRKSYHRSKPAKSHLW